MQFVGMDVTNTDTANDDLENALAFALRSFGITPAHPLTNADFADLENEDLDELLDKAELRLLQDIQGNFAGVDITVGDRTERLSQFSEQLKADVEALTKRIDTTYTTGDFTTGYIDLGFQSKYPPDLFI